MPSLPFDSAACTNCLASSEVAPGGFSTKICFPALRQSMRDPRDMRWLGYGVHDDRYRRI